MMRQLAQFGRVLWLLIHQPLLGYLLRSRTACVSLVAVCFALAFFAMCGLPLYECPIHAVTTVPCPGCGLTRSASYTMTGQWKQAITTHAFGPGALVFGLCLLVGALLPTRRRLALAERIATFETRTGISGFLIIAMWVYWVSRLFGLIGGLPT